MKEAQTMKKSAIIAIILITQSLNPLVTANAGPDHSHDHGHSHVGNQEIMIPETREDLWQAIQKEHASLLDAVKANDDGAVHHAEEKLQAYLKALPEMIADLDEGVRKRIEGQARNLTRAYGAVHHASDDQAFDKATAEMKKAEGGMKLLAAQMPR
jgi:hypothetical protein